jgi:hypothetical protein
LYEIHLEEGETVIFTPVALSKTDLSIDAIDICEEDHHLFGLRKKTKHLPDNKISMKIKRVKNGSQFFLNNNWKTIFLS